MTESKAVALRAVPQGLTMQKESYIPGPQIDVTRLVKKKSAGPQAPNSSLSIATMDQIQR